MIDPFKKTVAVYCKRHKAREPRPGDTLTADEIIPGFRVAVAELFEEAA